MPKRHADSTPDEKPAKRRRRAKREADEVAALAAGKRDFAGDPYDAVCCMCRENQQDSLGAILARHYPPDTRNAGVANVSVTGGETERTLPALLDVCDKTGRTPLMICARKGRFECLVLLLEAGAGLDVVSPHGNTALHHAAASKNKKQAGLVNMLLKHGAKIEAGNNFGATPLHLAITRGNRRAAVALLEGGASFAAVDGDGNTALHRAAVWKNKKQVRLVKRLLKHGASIEAGNKSGATPLHLAITHRNKSAAVALLEGGASLAAVDGGGNTALHRAAASKNKKAAGAAWPPLPIATMLLLFLKVMCCLPL